MVANQSFVKIRVFDFAKFGEAFAAVEMFKKLAYKQDDEMVAIVLITKDGSEWAAFTTPATHSGIAMNIQITPFMFLIHDPP